MKAEKIWLRVVVALLIWFSVVILFFAPASIGDKVIAANDCVECVFSPFAERPIEEVHNQFVVDGASQYVPHKWVLKEQWNKDGYMGWNPYVFNGTASPENTMYSPGDWHNYLFAFLSFWDAWNLGILLHFFIAGAGMLLLLRYCGVSACASFLAAVSFAFYSQFIICMYYRWLGSMVWAPYLVWALLQFKRYIVNVPAIIFMALVWRGGHMQSCVFAFLLVACVWCAEIWKQDGQRPGRKEFIRITISYLLTGVVGALLSLDVFVDTLPRMEGCKSLSQGIGINNAISFITLLFPNAFGVPHTHDALKAVGLSLFDIKFGGGMVCILAIMACFNARAPRVAKFIFLICAVAVCSPLITYLYSRATVVMALGMAWLAAWQLHDFTRVQNKIRYWRNIAWGIAGVAALWLVASLVIHWQHDSISDICNSFLSAKSKAVHQFARQGWYAIRVERFLSQILIWHWQNILMLACLALGIICCSRIKVGGGRNALWILGVVCVTYCELIVFSHSWISYSERIDEPYPYSAPEWMPELKKHVKDGTVSVSNPGSDSDFLLRNHLSVYGVRLADGYETVRPKFIHPLRVNAYEPEDYAQAGISHILTDTKWVDKDFPGWSLVMTGKQFKLYENPAYLGRFIVDDAVPLVENWRTCSRIHLTIPAHAKKLSVLESYHKGWSACAGGRELEIQRSERGGMDVVLPPSDGACEVLLEFHMPYRTWYHSIMFLTAIFLAIVAMIQVKRRNRFSQESCG